MCYCTPSCWPEASSPHSSPVPHCNHNHWGIPVLYRLNHGSWVVNPTTNVRLLTNKIVICVILGPLLRSIPQTHNLLDAHFPHFHWSMLFSYGDCGIDFRGQTIIEYINLFDAHFHWSMLFPHGYLRNSFSLTVCCCYSLTPPYQTSQTIVFLLGYMVCAYVYNAGNYLAAQSIEDQWVFCCELNSYPWCLYSCSKTLSYVFPEIR
jgi:hypothetical protein